MNRWTLLFVATYVAFAFGATAQTPPNGGQAPDPVFMTKAVQVLQQQRNNAQDQLAAEQARRIMVEEEVTKLKVELEAATKKLAEKPKE